MEDYSQELIKQMIKKYKERYENADREERPVYWEIIEDLKGMLVDIKHH
jgi:hypothetical protein